MAKKLWFFKHEYWGDDWQEYDGSAYTAEFVAEAVAEDFWSGDPCDPSNFEMTFQIREGETGAVTKVAVSAEPQVRFYSRIVT